jgi:hypothetical protein
LRRAYDYWQNQPGCYLSFQSYPAIAIVLVSLLTVTVNESNHFGRRSHSLSRGLIRSRVLRSKQSTVFQFNGPCKRYYYRGPLEHTQTAAVRSIILMQSLHYLLQYMPGLLQPYSAQADSPQSPGRTSFRLVSFQHRRPASSLAGPFYRELTATQCATTSQHPSGV